MLVDAVNAVVEIAAGDIEPAPHQGSHAMAVATITDLEFMRFQHLNLNEPLPKPGDYFLIGHSEMLHDINHTMTVVAPSIHRKT